jgi:hypothetical protein
MTHIVFFLGEGFPACAACQGDHGGESAEEVDDVVQQTRFAENKPNPLVGDHACGKRAVKRGGASSPMIYEYVSAEP